MLFPAVAVLDAERTVGEARELLRLYHGDARVVVRRLIGPEVVWHELRVTEIRAGLETADERASLAESLAFAAPVEVWAHVGREPDPSFAGLVLAGDRVLGIAEPGRAKEEPAAAEMFDEEDEECEAAERAFMSFARPQPVGEPQPVAVYYATDRKPTGSEVANEFYGGGRGSLAFGRLVVTIPPGHEEGQIERPRRGREDPYWHVVLELLEPLDRATFVDEVRNAVGERAERSGLLFLHGYNVDFASAARRAAQMAFDLGFTDRGVTMLYSWPSKGNPKQYGADETNARWTLEHFEEFLQLAMTELGIETLHVIAHSMGNRPLIEALRVFDVGTLPAGAAALHQIVFAAPDFDADTFRNLAARFRGKARRCTLYASSQDRALKLSRIYRSNLSRAGESGPGLVIVPGVDTVDATGVRTDFLGHSYYGERTVLDDIQSLITANLEPDRRQRITRRERDGRRYWQIGLR